MQSARDEPRTRGRRFVPGAWLASGAHGEVWAATDTLTGEPAVIKRMVSPSPAVRLRFRREVASLRGIAVPGVARLLDADEEPDGLWLAMARVVGQPFPGHLPARWATLAPVVDLMLGALATLHRLGLVHGDIKPANVLITADGQPVIVDLGLAGAAGRRSDGAGTPGYMAPEQADLEEVDGRADLYAVGRMLVSALDGDPELPAAVWAALQELIAEDPEDRPESAGEALRRLGRDGLKRAERAIDALDAPMGPLKLEDLERLFAGHERILRLRSDGARALWRRSGGERGRVAQVLAAWVREGLARWEADRVVLPRTSLDALASWAWPSGEAIATGLDAEDAAWLPWIQLLGAEARVEHLRALRPEAAAGLDAALSRLIDRGALLRDDDLLFVLAWPPGYRARLLPVSRAEAAARIAALLPTGRRLRHLILAGEPPALVAREAELAADRHLQEGRPAAAISTLELALPAPRRAGDAPAEVRLLRCWARAALSLSRPADLDRALFELGRGPETLAPEGRLLHGARRSVAGDGQGALAILDEIPAFDNEDLEIWRVAMRVHASWRCAPPRVEALLESLDPWAAERPARVAALAGWRGAAAFVSERYAEAAALHEAAAQRKTVQSARRSSLLNAANAWLEHGDVARAAALAEQVRLGAEQARHAAQTLECERLSRATQLRAPDAARGLTPDLELVDLAFSLGRPANAAMVALGEATLAFRQGDAALCRALSLRADAGFRREHLEGPAALCRALALALGPDQATGRALLQDAERCAAPGLAVQIAALAAWTTEDAPLREGARALILRRAPEVRADRSVQQEVLSLDEILMRTGISSIGTTFA